MCIFFVNSVRSQIFTKSSQDICMIFFVADPANLTGVLPEIIPKVFGYCFQNPSQDLTRDCSSVEFLSSYKNIMELLPRFLTRHFTEILAELFLQFLQKFLHEFLLRFPSWLVTGFFLEVCEISFDDSPGISSEISSGIPPPPPPRFSQNSHCYTRKTYQGYPLIFRMVFFAGFLPEAFSKFLSILFSGFVPEFLLESVLEQASKFPGRFSWDNVRNSNKNLKKTVETSRTNPGEVLGGTILAKFHEELFDVFREKLLQKHAATIQKIFRKNNPGNILRTIPRGNIYDIYGNTLRKTSKRIQPKLWGRF